MTCPRCGLAEAAEPACPRCGVIFAKVQSAARPRPATQRPPSPAPAPSGNAVWAGIGVALLAFLAGAGFWLRQPRVVKGRESLPSSVPVAHVPATSADQVPPQTLPAPAAVPILPQVETRGLSDADHQAADMLVARLRHPPVGAADLQLADDLVSRNPEDPGLRSLLVAALLDVGRQEQKQRQYAAAASRFGRAIILDPRLIGARLALLGLHLDAADWTAAEAAARDALALDSNQPDAMLGLATALFRQDRNREAVEVLHRLLETRESAEARALLQRLEKTAADEKGMREQRLAHFHVRYDGDAHEEIGRAILSLLERHHATLVTTLDHELTTTIPVILFSQQEYYEAAGAPIWSGGAFDSVDGRIRIPIGGLTASLGSGIDGVLMHEVTHAFINEISHGAAPREIHEGLAQYMEGRRVDNMLTPEQEKMLANGQARGVTGFYLDALSFVEFLQRSRGQRAMNELLRVMGETGSVDKAFQQAYGDDYKTVQKRWLSSRWRQSGD